MVMAALPNYDGMTWAPPDEDEDDRGFSISPGESHGDGAAAGQHPGKKNGTAPRFRSMRKAASLLRKSVTGQSASEARAAQALAQQRQPPAASGIPRSSSAERRLSSSEEEDRPLRAAIEARDASYAGPRAATTLPSTLATAGVKVPQKATAPRDDGSADYAAACRHQAAADPDLATAAAALGAAAAKGHAQAQLALGVAYECGEGVEPDDGEAARWYGAAAAQGSAQAACNLACLLLDGGENAPPGGGAPEDGKGERGSREERAERAEALLRSASGSGLLEAKHRLALLLLVQASAASAASVAAPPASASGPAPSVASPSSVGTRGAPFPAGTPHSAVSPVGRGGFGSLSYPDGGANGLLAEAVALLEACAASGDASGGGSGGGDASLGSSSSSSGSSTSSGVKAGAMFDLGRLLLDGRTPRAPDEDLLAAALANAATPRAGGGGGGTPHAAPLPPGHAAVAVVASAAGGGISGLPPRGAARPAAAGGGSLDLLGATAAGGKSASRGQAQVGACGSDTSAAKVRSPSVGSVASEAGSTGSPSSAAGRVAPRRATASEGGAAAAAVGERVKRRQAERVLRAERRRRREAERARGVDLWRRAAGALDHPGASHALFRLFLAQAAASAAARQAEAAAAEAAARAAGGDGAHVARTPRVRTPTTVGASAGTPTSGGGPSFVLSASVGAGAGHGTGSGAVGAAWSAVVGAEEALACLERAAELGLPVARCDLGLLLLHGCGGSGTGRCSDLDDSGGGGGGGDDDAFEGRLGSSSSSSSSTTTTSSAAAAARSSSYGLVVERDPGVAMGHLAAAAHAGLGPAMEALGALFDDGTLVGRDVAKAAAWLRRAGEAGEASAMARLARLLLEENDEGEAEEAEAAVKAGGTTEAAGEAEGELEGGAAPGHDRAMKQAAARAAARAARENEALELLESAAAAPPPPPGSVAAFIAASTATAATTTTAAADHATPAMGATATAPAPAAAADPAVGLVRLHLARRDRQRLATKKHAQGTGGDGGGGRDPGGGGGEADSVLFARLAGLLEAAASRGSSEAPPLLAEVHERARASAAAAAGRAFDGCDGGVNSDNGAGGGSGAVEDAEDLYTRALDAFADRSPPHGRRSSRSRSSSLLRHPAGAAAALTPVADAVADAVAGAVAGVALLARAAGRGHAEARCDLGYLLLEGVAGGVLAADPARGLALLEAAAGAGHGRAQHHLASALEAAAIKASALAPARSSDGVNDSAVDSLGGSADSSADGSVVGSAGGDDGLAAAARWFGLAAAQGHEAAAVRLEALAARCTAATATAAPATTTAMSTPTTVTPTTDAFEAEAGAPGVSGPAALPPSQARALRAAVAEARARVQASAAAAEALSSSRLRDVRGGSDSSGGGSGGGGGGLPSLATLLEELRRPIEGAVVAAAWGTAESAEAVDDTDNAHDVTGAGAADKKSSGAEGGVHGDGGAAAAAAAAARQLEAVDALSFAREVNAAADRLHWEWHPRVHACAAKRERDREGRLFGGDDDGAGREERRLAEHVGRLARECGRKERALGEVFARARAAKLERRRRADRSLRTVEGYDAAWFEPPDGADGGGSGDESGGGGGAEKAAAAAASGLRALLGGGSGCRRGGDPNLLSAGARVSARMGSLIAGAAGRGGGEEGGAAVPVSDEFGDLLFEPGLFVWKVEAFAMVPDEAVAASGLLLRGNSYVVVSVAEDAFDEDAKGRGGGAQGGGSGGGGLVMSLFHWVGSAAPLDQKTVASFKCTELARRLRADMAAPAPGMVSAKRVTIAREAEGAESPEFLLAFDVHADRLAAERRWQEQHEATAAGAAANKKKKKKLTAEEQAASDAKALQAALPKELRHLGLAGLSQSGGSFKEQPAAGGVRCAVVHVNHNHQAPLMFLCVYREGVTQTLCVSLTRVSRCACGCNCVRVRVLGTPMAAVGRRSYPRRPRTTARGSSGSASLRSPRTRPRSRPRARRARRHRVGPGGAGARRGAGAVGGPTRTSRRVYARWRGPKPVSRPSGFSCSTRAAPASLCSGVS